MKRTEAEQTEQEWLSMHSLSSAEPDAGGGSFLTYRSLSAATVTTYNNGADRYSMGGDGPRKG